PSQTNPIGFDIGLPGLQMKFPTTTGSVQNTADLTFGFDTVFNFGVDVANGFNVDTSTNDTLTFNFSAAPRINPATGKPAPLSGTFGFFSVDVVPDKNRPLYGNTGFSGAFTINVPGGGSVPGKLVYQDLIDDRFAIRP